MNDISTRYDVATWLKDERSDRCEHVSENPTRAVVVLCEDDTFGPLVRNILCRECFDQHNAEVSSVQCKDCGQKKPHKNMLQWRWYDFYAPQGDVALHVCDVCWNKPKHKERMQDDAARAREEDEYYERRRHSTAWY